ncbi:hypothetical protein BCR44DRAFT_1509710 [Catenaria anguillulae PL171]|uniref:Ankyrin repeat-containing domain protein n=1 Tax=Catenaria anguillulae PL171 TaxID=765915 RepID=A0A1Y2I4Q9_9FUNG|nr:hypothetical protein BCR44DRAFT_1509710 [Catenaria anguillulae PL171]
MPSYSLPAAAASPPPKLPLDTHELILTTAVRVTTVACHWNLQTTGRLLCILPRDLVPSPTKAVFIHFPWIDVDHVSQFDCVSTLKFLLKWSQEVDGRPIRNVVKVFPSVIDRATACGSIDSLNWWFYESGLPVGEWTAKGVEHACAAGHVNVLRWWYLSGKEFKISDDAVKCAARHGHLPVLKLLLHDCNMKERMTRDVVAATIECKQWDAVDWWKGVGLPLAAIAVSRLFWGALESNVMDDESTGLSNNVRRR